MKVKECLFNEYSLYGEIPTISFKQLLKKCRCEDCQDKLNRWYNEKRED